MSIVYKSSLTLGKFQKETYQLMRDGVSDMHCMSDLYLAEELKEEYDSKNL